MYAFRAVLSICRELLLPSGFSLASRKAALCASTRLSAFPNQSAAEQKRLAPRGCAYRFMPSLYQQKESTMTTTNNPTSARRVDASTARSGADLNRVSRPARGGETKAFYKTTEFVVFVV